MPRTPAYVSPFESLIKKPADRRSVIAAGVTAMLALPAAAAMAGAGDNTQPQIDDDWPGFSEWVADAVALDDLYEHGRLHWHEWPHEQQVAHEAKIDEHARAVWQEATEMARLMERVVDNSPKRLAMLVTLAIWGSDQHSHNSFDFAAMPDTDCGGEMLTIRLLRALGPFAAATLPEVPFGRRYATGGRANA